jgi:hypothetical protein
MTASSSLMGGSSLRGSIAKLPLHNRKSRPNKCYESSPLGGGIFPNTFSDLRSCGAA